MIKESLTNWMDAAKPGSRIYFRTYPGATTYSEEEFYEKDSQGWVVSSGESTFPFTTDSFSDEEDELFFREEAK